MTCTGCAVDLYLLHLDPPLGHARHYLGSCSPGRAIARLGEHGSGRGAALTRAAVAGGSSLYIVNVWSGVRRYEEVRLKRGGHLRRFCPVCLGHRQLTDIPPACIFPALPPVVGLSWPAPRSPRKRP